jgi:hypothetical protein
MAIDMVKMRAEAITVRLLVAIFVGRLRLFCPTSSYFATATRNAALSYGIRLRPFAAAFVIVCGPASSRSGSSDSELKQQLVSKKKQYISSNHPTGPDGLLLMSTGRFA